MSINRINVDEKLLKQWKEEGEEARAIRRQEADWNFIKAQSSPLREALEAFVELGDLYVASRIARMTVDEFNQLRIRAKIPVVV